MKHKPNVLIEKTFFLNKLAGEAVVEAPGMNEFLGHGEPLESFRSFLLAIQGPDAVRWEVLVTVSMSLELDQQQDTINFLALAGKPLPLVKI